MYQIQTMYEITDRLKVFEFIYSEEYTFFTEFLTTRAAAEQISSLLCIEHKSTLELIGMVNDLLEDRPDIIDKVYNRVKEGNVSFAYPVILLYYAALYRNPAIVLNNFEVATDANEFLSLILEDLGITHMIDFLTEAYECGQFDNYIDNIYDSGPYKADKDFFQASCVDTPDKHGWLISKIKDYDLTHPAGVVASVLLPVLEDNFDINVKEVDSYVSYCLLPKDGVEYAKNLFTRSDLSQLNEDYVIESWLKLQGFLKEPKLCIESNNYTCWHEAT